MGADGTLKTIQDRNNNVLTFTPTESRRNQRPAVSFTRDAQGRITKILTPLGDVIDTPARVRLHLRRARGSEHGDAPAGQRRDQQLTTATTAPTGSRAPTDPTGTPPGPRPTTPPAARHDTDALGNLTTYAYDVPGHTTTTTYPDTGVLAQTFDDNGHAALADRPARARDEHEYDANRNQTKRTNALGEVTKYTYDANGNQTSSTNRAQRDDDHDLQRLLRAADDHGPHRQHDDHRLRRPGLPTSFTDSLGLLATFTSSEHGLPIHGDRRGREHRLPGLRRRR